VVSACPRPSTYPRPFAVSLSLHFDAHILAPLRTHPHQVHVENVIRSFRRPLQCHPSSKSLNSVRSCASPRARNIRAHDETNLSKCDPFPSCSSGWQSHFLRPSSPLSLHSRNAIHQRRLLTPLLAQTGTLQLDAKSRMLWLVGDFSDPNSSHYSSHTKSYSSGITSLTSQSSGDPAVNLLAQTASFSTASAARLHISCAHSITMRLLPMLAPFIGEERCIGLLTARGHPLVPLFTPAETTVCR
jgi:hypothetical protein